MLSRAGEFFSLEPARIPSGAELALRRSVQRRHKVMVDTNRAYRRLLAHAGWAFPDVWVACGHSRATALAVLRRWPHLAVLGLPSDLQADEGIQQGLAHDRGDFSAPVSNG